MKFLKRTVCAVLILIIVMAPLAGCSSKNSSSQSDGTGAQGGNWQGGSGFSRQNGEGTQSGSASRRMRGTQSGSAQDTASGSQSGGAGQWGGGTAGGTNGGANGASSGQTQILGKVTSIIGNEVELAIGTQSGGQSSTGFTPTGESQTLLIPVGLSLSSSFGGTSGAAGISGASGAAAGGAKGNAVSGGNVGAATGTARTGTAGANRTGTAAATRTGTAAAAGTATTTVKRATDFSSITKGMVLRITQRTIDGTPTVVRVAIVSR